LLDPDHLIILAAFAATTTSSIILYKIVRREAEEKLQVRSRPTEIDEEALERLRERLLAHERIDAGELLKELKAIKSEVEKILSDEERRGDHGQKSSDPQSIR